MRLGDSISHCRWIIFSVDLCNSISHFLSICICLSVSFLYLDFSPQTYSHLSVCVTVRVSMVAISEYHWLVVSRISLVCRHEKENDLNRDVDLFNLC